MVKHLIYFLLALLSLDSLKAQEYAIDFENSSWEEVVKKAREEKKMIFIDAYASWCRPCKVMEAETFTDIDVGDFYNENFINARFDMEEPGDGQFLSELFEITAYPSLVFVDPSSGEMLYKKEGLLYPDDFISLGRLAIEEIPKSMTFKERYESGDRDVEFLKEYVDNIVELELDEEQPILDYLSLISQDQLLDPYHSELLMAYVDDVSSKEFQFFLQEKESFESYVGIQRYNFKIYISYLSRMISLLADEKPNEIDGMIEDMSEAGIKDYEEIVNYSHLQYYLIDEDYGKAIEAALKLDSNPGIFEEDIFDKLAWTIYENTSSSNRSLLQGALTVSRKSLNENDLSDNNDTYASILHKLGKVELAINYEKRAVELAEMEDSDNYTYYLEKLYRWENGK